MLSGVRSPWHAGIGEATVKLLVARGARVIIADIAEEAGTKLAESLQGKAAFCRCDVTCEYYIVHVSFPKIHDHC